MIIERPGQEQRNDSRMSSPCVGAPPPPLWYDPGFSRAVTISSALLLCTSIMVVVWLAVEVPKIGRVADPERALGLMVSRLMDSEAGLEQAPAWERTLYAMTLGDNADERAQAITWYLELASVSVDPLVELNLAVLQAEAGRLTQVGEQTAQWNLRGDPLPLFGEVIRAAYLDGRLSSMREQELQAHIAELVPAGWFYDRLATRLAQNAGDRALLASLESQATARTSRLVARSRVIAGLEIAIMLLGGVLLVVVWKRSRLRLVAWPLGRAQLPPSWAGGLGAAVLLRGGAIGAILTLAFLFAATDHSSLRVLVIPLSNLPLLALAYVHLLKPQGLTFVDGFGLRVPWRHSGRLGGAILAVVAAGLLGEWVLGRIIEPLNLSSHWTEWFDSDLVWASSWVLTVTLMEYVLFAPIFEELAFRGLLFGILRRRYRWGPAAVISAGIFAIAHGYGLVGFVSVFWSGLLWAWIYEKTGSLVPSMAAHAINNLLVCVSVMALLRY